VELRDDVRLLHEDRVDERDDLVLKQLTFLAKYSLENPSVVDTERILALRVILS
jgi:hypothetical protein